MARIARILDGRAGDALSEEDSETEKMESARRIERKLPPGYRDSKKDEPHGDYFVWCQTLREAQQRSPHVLVFVTSDTKDDWYLRLKGQTIMARPELVLECKEKTRAKLVLLSIRNFLSHTKNFLEADVSDETIRQAEQAQIADDRNRLVPLQEGLLSITRLHQEQTGRLTELLDAKAAAQEEYAIAERRRKLAYADCAATHHGAEARAKADKATSCRAEVEPSRSTSISNTAKNKLDAIVTGIDHLQAAIESTDAARAELTMEYDQMVANTHG
ncbi:PIN-like domain-containing protein [Actinoplanes sp. NPDC049118]|uniref:PIN-like domain-containing protein n=1 Tax=Actinoplanes sp. NPDC049118 TaxID=3155769 RepID=UPI0033D76EBF